MTRKINIAPYRKALVIGASAGGFDALRIVLKPFPTSFPAPILVVQHQSALSDNFLVRHLDSHCHLQVQEAEEKTMALAGHVYIAPPNYHLLVEEDFTLSLSTEERVCYARPSIDVLFETAARAWGPGLVALILTGANKDGSAGLRFARQRGGLTVVQDPATAVADVMPLAALHAAPAHHVVSLDQLGTFLRDLFPGKSHA